MGNKGGMLQRIRQSYITRGVAFCLAFNLLGEMLFPAISYSLTSGPIDINQASFEPASSSEMVNLASGDFTYNIPLLDVGGYPLNIAYHGGVSMEQESSIVGLGWTLNVGAMNRIKRGLPDDFKGDEVLTDINIRPRTSTGGTIGAGIEWVGADVDNIITPSVGVNFGVSFSNYTGYGIQFGLDGGLKIGKKNSFYNLGLGLGLESSSEDGVSISPNANLKAGNAEVGIGFTANTTQGLQNINLNSGIGISDSDGATMGLRRNSTVPVSTVTFTPSVSFERNVNLLNFNFDLGLEFASITTHGKAEFYKSRTCLKEFEQVANAYGYLYEDEKDNNENYLLDFNRAGTVIPNKHIAYLPVTNHTFDVNSYTGDPG